MSGRIIIRKAGTQFHFNLFAANSEPILSSEGYTTKAAVQTGAQSVKTNAGDDRRYDCRTSSANQPYFVLKAANGEVIGTSEMYSSLWARDNGIASCKANGPVAELVDQA